MYAGLLIGCFSANKTSFCLLSAKQCFEGFAVQVRKYSLDSVRLNAKLCLELDVYELGVLFHIAWLIC